MPYRIVLLLSLFSVLEVKSQAGLSKQELLRVISGNAADTALINAYNELTWPVYSYDNPDSSIYYGNKAIDLATKTNDTKRLSIAHRRIGITYINTGDIKDAIQHQEESYLLSEKINYKKGMQLALNNIGVAYLNNELLSKALSYFLRSLRLVEENRDYSSAASLYINCGMIYSKTGDLLKSKEYYLKAKQLAIQLKDKNTLLTANSNLSTYYRNRNMSDSAAYYLAEAKKCLSDETATSTKFNFYLNEGLFLSYQGQHQKALSVFLLCSPYVSVATDEITLLINVAEEYKKLNESDKALSYFKKAYALSEKDKMYDNLEYISASMAELYESKKDFKNFAEMLKKHVIFQDSNAHVNRIQQLFRQQLEFDFERKHVADSVRFEQMENLKNAELQVADTKLTKERSARLMLLVILILLVVFALFILNRFLLTNKQKKIIEQQKVIVELKNHEILDSINYAKRLQSAILPQVSEIKKELDFDILYLPKDIIGGDFYYFEKHQGHVFIAVCDCTGHGIPGAIMSVVCHQALDKSIKEFHLTEPDEILNKTKHIVMESLNATHQNIKDGMDCSLLVLNKNNNEISWSGANNPIWHLEKNNFKEIKADKQPVAFYENHKPFTKHMLSYEKGSILYLLTDGYADQFGGPNAKKYKYKPLKEFLIAMAHLPLEQQVKQLEQNFLNWKGELDQVDDVAIAIIRL